MIVGVDHAVAMAAGESGGQGLAPEIADAVEVALVVTGLALVIDAGLVGLAPEADQGRTGVKDGPAVALDPGIGGGAGLPDLTATEAGMEKTEREKGVSEKNGFESF